MKTETRSVRTCPICGNSYTGHPALSRTDGETPICPSCYPSSMIRTVAQGRYLKASVL